MFLRVSLQTEHSAQDGTDHHCCRPDLMRRTGRERFVIISGQHFAEMAQGTVQTKQGIRAQIRVRREFAVVAVFADRRPACE